MLLIFSDEFLGRTKELFDESEFHEAIDNLTIAHRKGLHLLGGKPKVLNEISAGIEANDAKGVLRAVAQKYYQQQSILDELNAYVIVEPRADAEVFSSETAGKKIFRVSYRYFKRFSAVQPTRFIAEDAQDRRIYIHALEGYRWLARTGIGRLPVSHTGFNGGGSRTSEQLKDCADEGLTIAIVDSDRRCADDSLGATASDALDRLAKIKRYSICDVSVLPCHEIENLLPRLMLKDVIERDDGSEFRRRWMFIVDKVLVKNNAIVRFFDLKEGIRGFDVSNAKTPQLRTFLRSILASCGIVPSGICECRSRDKCSCTLIDGLGDEVCRRVEIQLSKRTGEKISESLFGADSQAREHWLELGKWMLSWMCAASKLRS